MLLLMIELKKKMKYADNNLLKMLYLFTGTFSRPLVTFANIFDPGEAQYYVAPHLRSKLFDAQQNCCWKQ